MIKKKIVFVLGFGFLFSFGTYCQLLMMPSQEKISICKKKIECLMAKKEQHRYMLFGAIGLLSCASIYWLLYADTNTAISTCPEDLKNAKMVEILTRVESMLSESWATWLGKQSAQLALGALVSITTSALYGHIPLADIAYEQLVQARDFNWFLKKQTNIPMLLEHFAQQLQDANSSTYRHEQLREHCTIFWNIFSEHITHLFAFIEIALEKEIEKDSFHAYLSMLKNTLYESCQTFIAAVDDWDFHKASKEDLTNKVLSFKRDFLAQIERFSHAQHFIM